MPLMIWKDFSFSAAHRIASLPEGHQCRRMHGHTYTVRVWLTGQIDMPTGMCGGVEFGTIKKTWAVIGDSLDHHVLNDTLGENATVEHLAVYLYAQFKQLLPQVCRVDVSEGPNAGASFGE